MIATKSKPDLKEEARSIKFQAWLWDCITKEATCEGITQAAVVRRAMMQRYGKRPFIQTNGGK